MKIIHPSWLNSVDYSIPKHVMTVSSLDIHISDRWFCTSGQTDASVALQEQYNCSLCGYVAVWSMHALLNDNNAKKLLWFKHTRPNAVEIQVAWFPHKNTSILGSINSFGRFDLWNLKLGENNYAPKESKKPVWFKSDVTCFAWGSIAYLALGGENFLKIFEWNTNSEEIDLKEVKTIDTCALCLAASWHYSLEYIAVATRKTDENTYIYVYNIETVEVLNTFQTTAQLSFSNILWKDDNLLFSLEMGIAFVWNAYSNAQVWYAFTNSHSEEVSVINIAYCQKKTTYIITLGTRDGQFSFWSSSINIESLPSEPFIIAYNLLRGKVKAVSWTRTGSDAILASQDCHSNLSNIILVKLTEKDVFGENDINIYSSALIYSSKEIFEVTSNGKYIDFYRYGRNNETTEITKHHLSVDFLNGRTDRCIKIVRFSVSSKFLTLATDNNELHLFSVDDFNRLTNPITLLGKVLALRSHEWFLLLVEAITTECGRDNRCMMWSFEPSKNSVLADTSIPTKQGLQAIHISVSKSREHEKPTLKLIYNDLRSYIWDYDMLTWKEYRSYSQPKTVVLNYEMNDVNPDCLIFFNIYE